MIELTEQDWIVLESYKAVVDGLSAYLGSGYEIVLHRLDDYDHSVVKIVNGFHTGRSVNDPISPAALNVLDKISQDPEHKDYYCYFSKNKMGEPLKSTTIGIRGTQGKIIGLMCINLYLGTPYIHMISEMLPKENSNLFNEHYNDTPASIVAQELENAKEIVLNNSLVPPFAKNKEIIRILQSKRVFEIKNSVEQVANDLNLSINTVYFHIRNVSKQETD